MKNKKMTYNFSEIENNIYNLKYKDKIVAYADDIELICVCDYGKVRNFDIRHYENFFYCGYAIAYMLFDEQDVIYSVALYK